MITSLQDISAQIQDALSHFSDLGDEVWETFPEDHRCVQRPDGEVVASTQGRDHGALANGRMIARLPETVLALREIGRKIDAEIARNAPLPGQLTDDSRISGQKFEDFYRNHYPSGWILEELPYEASDEHDVWVMDPDREEPFRWFGYAIRMGDGTEQAGPHLTALEARTPKDHSVSLAEVYMAVYADLALEDPTNTDTTEGPNP